MRDEGLYTTIEEAEHLIEIGLDPASCDIWYEQRAEFMTDPFEWKAFVGENMAIKNNLFSYRNRQVIPCWSALRLMTLLPETIKVKDTVFNLFISFREGRWYAEYQDQYFHHMLFCGYYTSLVNMIISMFESLKKWRINENGEQEEPQRQKE